MRDRYNVLPPRNAIQQAIATPRRHLEFGCFALDLDGRILIDPSGREVELRRREFDLLLTFARSPGRVMSREILLDAIAGRETEAFDRTIDVYVDRGRPQAASADRHRSWCRVSACCHSEAREPPIGC